MLRSCQLGKLPKLQSLSKISTLGLKRDEKCHTYTYVFAFTVCKCMSHDGTYHLERSASASQKLCLIQGKLFLKPIPDFLPLPQHPWKKIEKKNDINKKVWHVALRLISSDNWFRYVVTACHMGSLLDRFLHVFFTEVSCLWSTMPIKHSKVEDAVSHLRDLEAVFILFSLTNEGGTAYFR